MPRQGRPDGSGLCDDEGGWYSDPVALRRGQAPALRDMRSLREDFSVLLYKL